MVSNDHFAIGRLFPKGVTHLVAPRGRAQLERIDAFVTAIDDVLASPQLAADPDADELRQILETGKAAVLDAVASLRPAVEA